MNLKSRKLRIRNFIISTNTAKMFDFFGILLVNDMQPPPYSKGVIFCILKMFRIEKKVSWKHFSISTLPKWSWKSRSWNFLASKVVILWTKKKNIFLFKTDKKFKKYLKSWFKVWEKKIDIQLYPGNLRTSKKFQNENKETFFP